MKRFVLVSIIATAFFVFYSGPAHAQEAPPADVVYCGELDADDCARLAASPAAMAGLTSGASANLVEVTVYPASMGATGPISASVGLDGAFVAPPATIERMAELTAMGEAAIMADPALVSEALTLPLTIDTAQTVRISLSPSLADTLGAQFRGQLPATLSFETRFVDGVVYVHMADFAGFWPQATRFGEWIGIDVMFIVPDSLAQRGAAGQVTPDEVAEALTPPGAELPGAYIISVPQGQEEAYANFVEIVALRDTIVDGHAAAVYRIRWDLPAYLASPVVAERVYTASDGQVNLAPFAPLILMAATGLLQNLDNQVVQQIGLDDPYLYERDTAAGWSLGNLRFEVRNLSANRSLNVLEAIPAPENAFVPPLGLIWGLIQAVRQR